MGIKGLTDKPRLDLNARGRTVRLGYLQKGMKTARNPNQPAFGKNIQLTDLDYFRFRPIASDGEQAREMERLFHETYGLEPRAIDDVRLTADLAGNFRVEDCAWLTASIYGPRGATFLARSDGEYIRQMRNPETGKVQMFESAANGAVLEEYVRRHEDFTRLDEEGNPCFVWQGKLVPWQQSMAIDLILPDLNRRLYEAELAGHGVVTFLTHGTYDIATLIDEYYGILNEVMSLFAGTLNGSAEVARNHLPLRNIPLRLFRSEDKVTTPDYRTKDPASRLHSTRWLCHWQLAPEFAASMQQALDRRTQMTLAAVANMPLLVAGARPSIEQINADLFGDDTPTKSLPAATAPAPATPDPWGADEEVAPEELEGEMLPEGMVWCDWCSDYPAAPGEPCDRCREMGAKPAVDVPPLDWRQRALQAQDVSGWAMAAFQVDGTANALADAAATRRWYEHVIGDFDPGTSTEALEALAKYVSSVADGASKKDAIAAAKKVFAAALEIVF
ncbi:MAG: hypothetical protein KC418_22480 [Anaerolineales bacterium]|nr:hypothetical protein [Anaerolineales bacterium]